MPHGQRVGWYLHELWRSLWFAHFSCTALSQKLKYFCIRFQHLKHLFSRTISHQNVEAWHQNTFENCYLLMDFFARVVRLKLVLEVVVDLLLVPWSPVLLAPCMYFLTFAGETNTKNMKKPLRRFKTLVTVAKPRATWFWLKKTLRAMFTGSILQEIPKTRNSLQ